MSRVSRAVSGPNRVPERPASAATAGGPSLLPSHLGVAMARLDRSNPRIPVRGHLVPTGPVDALDWYYRRGIRVIMRSRLTWARDALLTHPADRVLEIGYGSGIFQYELSYRARMS